MRFFPWFFTTCALKMNVNRIVFFFFNHLFLFHLFNQRSFVSPCIFFCMNKLILEVNLLNVICVCVERKAKTNVKWRDEKEQSLLLHMLKNNNCQEVELKTKCVQKHIDQWSLIMHIILFSRSFTFTTQIRCLRANANNSIKFNFKTFEIFPPIFGYYSYCCFCFFSSHTHFNLDI